MTTVCSRCNAPLPEGSPMGACPACLMSMAQSPTSPDGSTVEHASVEQLQGRIPGVNLIEMVGSGGMGAVYRGYQTDLDREVAVKVLPAVMTGNPVFIERFRREAQALAKLDHQNIVTVYGSGVSDGLCYIVMEFVEGTTLRDAMRAEAIDPASALSIIPKICDALAYAHSQGVVHRDIKPENILLGTGDRVKVVDFGLAKMTESDQAATMLTATGTRLGTLRYMAPEQLDGTHVDHRADVYSLGVVLYEMLTGQVPMGQFAMPSEKAGTDPAIDDVIRRTLAREPEGRYQQVSEIESALKSVGNGQRCFGWDSPLAMTNSHSVPNNWKVMYGREWKSKSTIMGLPLIHMAYGYDRVTGKKLVAKGLIAIGDIAIGGLAMGGVGIGLLSIGGCAIGITALGGCAIGLQMGAGGAALGAIAVGGFALGLLALGGMAIGYLAFGGKSIGRFSIGGDTTGTYTMTRPGQWNLPEAADSPVAQMMANQNLPLYGGITAFAMVTGPLLLILACYLIGRAQSHSKGIKEAPMPRNAKVHMVAMLSTNIPLIVLLPVILVVVQAFILSRLGAGVQ